MQSARHCIVLLLLLYIHATHSSDRRIMSSVWDGLPADVQYAIACMLKRPRDKLNFARACRATLRLSHAGVQKLSIRSLGEDDIQRTAIVPFLDAHSVIVSTERTSAASWWCELLARFLSLNSSWVKHVTKLDIRGNINPPTTILLIICSQLPRLRELAVQCTPLDISPAWACLSNLSALESLSLHLVGPLSDLPVLTTLTCLRSLRAWHDTSSSALTILAKLTTLTSLELRHRHKPLTKETIDQIARLTHLRNLDISTLLLDRSEPGAASLDITPLSSLQQLHELSIADTSGHIPPVLSQLSSLSNLHLQFCYPHSIRALSSLKLRSLSIATVFHPLQQQPEGQQLMPLAVSSLRVDDDCLSAASFSRSAFSRLFDAGSIRVLRIAAVQSRAAGIIAQLQQVQQLTLELTGCLMTPQEVFSSITGLRQHLRSLHLIGAKCHLPDGYSSLQQCSKLIRLVLSRCEGISRAALVYLAGLTGLQELRVITAPGQQQPCSDAQAHRLFHELRRDAVLVVVAEE